MQLTDVTFADAIDFVRNFSGLSIYVNWGAIESELPDARSAFINLSLAEVSFEKALDLILDEAGGGIVELDWTIEGGVIRVTTQTKLSQRVYPVAYDVSDLLRVPRDLPYASEVQPPDRLHANPYTGEGDEPDPEERNHHLRDLIKSIVGGEMAWVDGGGRGQINYLDGTFIIYQTHANHKETRAFLAQLRAARRRAGIDRPVSIDARWVTADGLLSATGNGSHLPAALTTAQLAALTVVHHGRIACFNRRRVSVSGGSGELVVTGIEPVVSENVAAERPVVRMVHWGPILDITASIGRDGRTATAAIRSTVSAPAHAAAGGTNDREANGAVDALHFTIATLKTDVEIPLGRPVLVGGLTGPGDGPADLWLVLRVDAAQDW